MALSLTIPTGDIQITSNLNSTAFLIFGTSPGTLVASGGSPPYTYGITGGTVGGGNSTYVDPLGTGTLVVNQSTGNISFTVNTSLTVGVVTGVTCTVTDNASAQAFAILGISYTVNPELFMTPSIVTRVINHVIGGTFSPSPVPGESFSAVGGTLGFETYNAFPLGMLTYGTSSASTLFGVNFTYLPNVGILNALAPGTYFETSMTARVNDTIGDIADATYNIQYNVVPAVGLSPIPGATALRNQNSGQIISSNITGSLNAFDGRLPYTYSIPGGSLVGNLWSFNGTYGVLTLNQMTGDYMYILGGINVPSSPGPPYNDTITMQVMDDGTTTSTVNFVIMITINPDLVRQSLSVVQIRKAANGQFEFVGSDSTSTPASGGTPPYTYAALTNTTSAGNITILNDITTFIPNTNPDTFPNTAGTYNYEYTLRVTDFTTDFEDTTFRVSVEVIPSVMFIGGAPAVNITRNVNGTAFSTSIPLNGTLISMGGNPPIVYGLQGGTVGATETTLIGTYGTTTVNNMSGLYTYAITTFPNTIGNPSDTDTFVFTVSTQGLLSNSTATYNVNYVVNPELLRGSSAVSLTKIVDGSFAFFGPDTTSTPATGGTVSLPTDYIYGAISISGAYGTITILNDNTTYVPSALPNIVGNYTDVFTLTVQDTIGENVTSTFTANITVSNSSVINPIPNGIVTSNIGGPTVTSGLTGTATSFGGDPPITYGIVGGTSSGGNSSRVGTYGTLVVNETSGIFTYTVTNPLGMVGTLNDVFTVEVLSIGIQASTTTYTVVHTLNLPLALNPPTTGMIRRSVNDPNPPITSNLTGTLTGANGKSPYTFNIDGITTSPFPNFVQQMMMFGTLLLNTVTGAYVYTISVPPNIQGTYNEDFTVRITDSISDTKTQLLRITYDVLPELQVNMPGNGSVIKQIGNPNITQINLTGNISVTGGKTPYTYAVNGSNVGTYGTLTLNSITGVYTYGNLTIPDVVLSNTDVFNIDVTDDDGRVISTTLVIDITVTAGIMLITPSNGKIFKSVDGGNVTQVDVTGTIMQMGAGPPFTYGIQGGFTIGANQVAFGQHGQLTITIATGAYNYVPNPIPNVEDRFSDSFIITLVDGAGATARTTYQVDFQVNPQLLIDTPNPSRGSITRNIVQAGFEVAGLSGTYSPRGGLPPYAFSIQGGTDTGTFFEQTMSLGKLQVNKTTGFYQFIELNVPNTPGSFQNAFIIVVADGNGDTQTLEYVIQATVKSISLDLLPVFTDVENRSAIRYWNFVIHFGSTSQLTRFFENTEVLVIGQTDPNPAPERDIDAILRQLLLAAIETSEIGKGGEDVITNIRNNTKDVLETDERSGALTYSFRFTSKLSTDQEVERVIELADILSTSHKNFLLNRYRSNIGEGLVVFYFDDAPQTIIDQIFTQVEILSRIGVGGVILVLIATDITRDPAGTRAIDIAYARDLGTKQSQIIQRLSNVRTIKTIISTSIRYDNKSDRYQNVGVRTVVESGQSRVPEQLQYSIPTPLRTQTLFDGISSLPQFRRDTAFPQTDLRIVITEVNQTLDQARGTVLYSRLNALTTSATFISSRPLPPTQTANRTIKANITFLDVAENQSEEVIISATPSSAAHPRDLRPGDVLYNEAYRFAQPNQIILLISTVSGVNIQNAVGKTIFLQIDDGVRFPNNPVFPADVLAIDQRFNSNTLQPLGPSTSIQFGSDYQLRVQLPTVPGQAETFRAAPLEEYTKFPRLGFVTVYFGRETGTTTGIGPYARGSVLALTR